MSSFLFVFVIVVGVVIEHSNTYHQLCDKLMLIIFNFLFMSIVGVWNVTTSYSLNV